MTACWVNNDMIEETWVPHSITTTGSVCSDEGLACMGSCIYPGQQRYTFKYTVYAPGLGHATMKITDATNFFFKLGER